MQKLDVFHGLHKCMVPYMNTKATGCGGSWNISSSKLYIKYYLLVQETLFFLLFSVTHSSLSIKHAFLNINHPIM